MAGTNFGRPGLFSARNIIATVAVVVVVLGAFLLLRTMGGSEPPPAPVPTPEVVEKPPAPAPEEPEEEPPPPAPEYPMVLVASQDILPGVPLTSEMVEWQEWRAALEVELAVVKDVVDIRQVLGAVTLHPLEKGSLVSVDRIIRPGQPAFITAMLKPGRRAVTVEVDSATTEARIIYPGDYVDVVLVLDGSRFAEVGPSAQVLVRNVRVLAVGSSSLELGRFSASWKIGLSDSPATPPEGRTYTLEVTPLEAERLLLGAANGRLSLAIRSIGAARQAEDKFGTQLTRLDEVLRLPADDSDELPAPVLPAKVRVIRGGGRALGTEAIAIPPGTSRGEPATSAGEENPQQAQARAPA